MINCYKGEPCDPSLEIPIILLVIGVSVMLWAAWKLLRKPK